MKLLNLSMDARSLAILRVTLGLLSLLCTCLFLLEMRYFYLDTGPSPRAAVLQSIPACGWGLSAHMINGKVPYLLTLFLLQGGASVALIANRRPALAATGCWFLLLSAINRAPFLFFPSLQLLSVLLLWGIFLPWETKEGSVRTPASAVMVLQICATGWLSGYLRLSDSPLAWLGLLGPFLVLGPAPWVRGAGVAMLAVLYGSDLWGGSEPEFPLLCLAALPAVAPWRSPLVEVPRPSRLSLAVLTMLVALCVGSTVAALVAAELPGELNQLAQGLGLRQSWLPQERLDRFYTKVTMADRIFPFQDGARWRAPLQARFLSTLGNPSMQPLQTTFFNYVGRTLGAQGVTGRVDRVELIRVGEKSGETVVAAWVAAPRPGEDPVQAPAMPRRPPLPPQRTRWNDPNAR